MHASLGHPVDANPNLAELGCVKADLMLDQAAVFPHHDGVERICARLWTTGAHLPTMQKLTIQSCARSISHAEC